MEVLKVISFIFLYSALATSAAMILGILIFLSKKLYMNIKASSFRYCQRDLEMEGKCKKQCGHCKKYYAPLEDDEEEDTTVYLA